MIEMLTLVTILDLLINYPCTKGCMINSTGLAACHLILASGDIIVKNWILFLEQGLLHFCSAQLLKVVVLKLNKGYWLLIVNTGQE